MVGRRAFLSGIAASFVTGPLFAEEVVSTGISKRRLQRAADLATGFLADFRAPGLSVAYAKGGKLIYVAAFGVADMRTKEPLLTAHRFRIASVSKPITASAILALYDAGKLDLDQPVLGPGGILAAKYPIPSKARHQDWLAAVSVDHLLTHTAGGWGNDGLDPMFQDPQLSHAELIAATLERAPLSDQPGASYAYSNFGYCLLGRVIEEVSGQSYARYVRGAILEPSGAGSMEIAGNTAADRRGMEVAYLGKGGQSPYNMNVERMDAHGGWIGTATDLVNFAMHVDGYKSVPDILSAKSVKLAVTPGKVYEYYARGWAVNPQHRNRWHAGSLPGTTTNLVRVEGGASFSGLVNTRQSGGPDLNEALDALMWEIYDQVNG